MHTSSKSLPANISAQLHRQLYTLLADLRHPKEVQAVLSSLLGDVELGVIARRLAIVKMLDRGDSYSDIKSKLNVSSATISSLADAVSHSGWKIALEKLRVNDWVEKIVDFLDLLFYGQRAKRRSTDSTSGI